MNFLCNNPGFSGGNTWVYLFILHTTISYFIDLTNTLPIFNHIDPFPYCLALQIYIIFVHEFFYIPILCECLFSNNTPKLYV